MKPRNRIFLDEQISIGKIIKIKDKQAHYLINVLRCKINEKILIIDDLIATGGTAEAAAKLVEISGGKVAGFIFVINLFDLPGEKLLKDKGYLTKSLIEFPGH